MEPIEACASGDLDVVRDEEFVGPLDAARCGDPYACRWLWDRYAGQIKAFLLTRGTPDADEVVNDVFLAAFTGVGAFVGGEPEFRAWLYRIARNKRVDAIRAYERRPTPTDAPSRLSSTHAEADSEAVEALVDEEFRDVLATLTPDQRDVVVLRFLADLTLEQTATALDKPVGAVKSLQHRAIDQLRKKFVDHPYLPDPCRTMS